jgi:hypothetical protein
MMPQVLSAPQVVDNAGLHSSQGKHNPAPATPTEGSIVQRSPDAQVAGQPEVPPSAPVSIAHQARHEPLAQAKPGAHCSGLLHGAPRTPVCAAVMHRAQVRPPSLIGAQI